MVGDGGLPKVAIMRVREVMNWIKAVDSPSDNDLFNRSEWGCPAMVGKQSAKRVRRE